MKKDKNPKRLAIIIIIIVIAFALIGYTTYRILNDKNKLSVSEKEWITENLSVVQKVNVPNNLDVFGNNANGVFFDFIKSFEDEYKININEVTYNIGEKVSGTSFATTYEKDDGTVFYTDHFVIISKNKQNITSISQLSGHKIGVLRNDEKYVSKYINETSNIITTIYETSTLLYEALDKGVDIEYAIIPLNENLTSILTSNYAIDYHISDLNKYYVLKTEKDDTFGSILEKYYAKWQEKELSKSIDENELKTFIQALSISDKEISNIQANTYKYGFVNNSPYEVLVGGTYGGIVSEYISKFSSFSDTEFEFIKYNNFSKFTEAISNRKVDVFYNYYNLNTKYQKVESQMNISFVIIANEKNPLLINSISSLEGKTVYVQKNSLIEKYVSSLGGITVKTYENAKELKKISKKDNIIFLDEEVFNYYKKSFLADHSVRYSNKLTDTYNFYIKSNDTFNLLFSRYIQTLDPAEITVKGVYNNVYTVKAGTILGKVARYSLIVILLFIIILYLAYRSTKHIKITKKIKKEDKMKYIDQLTSLKNRNYLNENINNWNKNTIYPQATIVIDLNQVRNINDTMGYEEGDAQIKAAANVLIKTQLDNTDIMRTDGNEYLIYLVGYQEKQIVSYIRKLYKEFKSLPYEHGAAIGYSIITNDIKTIEDSINEATEDMRKKKEELLEGQTEDGKKA